MARRTIARAGGRRDILMRIESIDEAIEQLSILCS
jgi:hypothetical protein